MAGNQVFICTGTLGSNVKVRKLPSGALGEIDIFVKESWTNKSGERAERVQIFHANIWGNRILALEHLLLKGSKVWCQGKFVQRSSHDKETGKESKFWVLDVDVITVTHVKENGDYFDVEEIVGK